MKTSRRLLICLALSHMLTLDSISQNHKYIPFPDSNAIWVQKLLDEFGQIKYGYQYFIQKDTVINSLSYHKMVSSRDSLLHIPPNKPISWYGLRNDTAARKVFMFDNGSNQEWLLYDFSLNEGDTFPLSWGGTGRYYLQTITNIDTFQLQGKDHLIFYPHPGFTPYIEGVGSVSGLFEDTDFFEGGTELVCLMTGKDRFPYFTYLPNKCELYHWTGVNVVTETISEITVYPNPINRMSVIELYDGSDVIENLSVFDLTGRTIFEFLAIHGNTYPIGNLIVNKGLYFYRIESRNGKVYTGKMIRQ